MPEELNRDSISDQTRATTPAIEEAFEQAQRLQDRALLDVNGLHMGRITRCFADDDGHLATCEVHLSSDAQRNLGAPTNVAQVPAEWIARIEGDEVQISKSGEQVVRPEDPSPVHAEVDRGAQDLPRSIR